MSEQKFENFNTIKILKGTQLFIDLDPVQFCPIYHTFSPYETLRVKFNNSPSILGNYLHLTSNKNLCHNW
jgi:hypothetical protein